MGPGNRLWLLIAHSAGQALVPRLLNEYDVYVLDVQPRPSRRLLPSAVHYYQSATTTVDHLLSKYSFAGVVNLAGVSILEWCEADVQKCEEANVGSVKEILRALDGGNQKRWWKGSAALPWIVLGSGVDVYPEQGQPMSVLGRTKAAAERTLQEYVQQKGGGSHGYPLRAAIIRF